MIHFFRRIRQELINRERFGKYLLYAVGEIILVVAGILIALQINNLNEQRKENAKEQIVLKQLREEFNLNLNQLESKITMRHDLMKDLKECLNYFAIQQVDNDSLFTAKLTSLMLPLTFDPIQNDLVSSGNIQIIKNTELKKRLTNWTSDVHQLREVEQIYVGYFSNTIVPFFDKTGTGRNIIKYFWENSERTRYLLEEYDSEEIIFANSSISAPSISLLENSELESIISMAYALNITNSSESKTLRKRIDDILKLLDLEIE